MQRLPFNDIFPQVHDSVFLAEGSRIIGAVTIKEKASIWCNTVARGDVNKIEVGEYSNIQDNCTLHVADAHACIIGNYVTVGHNAILHGCTVHDNCLIGMGAIVLNGAVIGENSIVGAAALISENKIIPPNSLVVGTPGRVIRTLTPAEIEAVTVSAKNYYQLAETHRMSRKAEQEG